MIAMIINIEEGNTNSGIINKRSQNSPKIFESEFSYSLMVAYK